MDENKTQETPAAESKPKRPLGANQYTIAKEEGREPPKGQNHFTTGKRQKHDEETRDKMRAEKAARFLERVVDGEEPDATLDTKITASKALIPYGKASLASIQNTIREEPANEEEMTAALAHLLASNAQALKPILEADPAVRASLQSLLGGGPVPVQTTTGSADRPLDSTKAA